MRTEGGPAHPGGASHLHRIAEPRAAADSQLRSQVSNRQPPTDDPSTGVLRLSHWQSLPRRACAPPSAKTAELHSSDRGYMARPPDGALELSHPSLASRC